MGTIYKAQQNRDAKVLLTEGGTETINIEKTTTTTDVAVQVEKVKLTVDNILPAADNLGVYRSYYLENDAGELEEGARISVVATDASDGTEDLEFQFWNKRNGVLTKILTIDGAATLASDGNQSFSTARTVTILDNTDNAWSVIDSGGSPLTYLEFDSRDAGPLVRVAQTLYMQNTFDILPTSAGGCDLGSTSLEWGDIFIADSKSIKFGDGQDMALSWDASNLVLTSVAPNTGALVLGVSGEGIDLQLFGATAGYDVLWDESADTMIFNDGAKIQLGTTAGCATLSAATTTLSLLAVTDNNTFVIGASGNAFDVKLFGADSSGFITWDCSANDLKFEDSVSLMFGTGAGAGVGNAGDVELRWDATDLDLLAAANNTIFKIGNGTNSFDVWIYGSSTSHAVTWDASANILKLEDDDSIQFGTGGGVGPGNAGDFALSFNATNLLLLGADNSNFTIGDSTHGTDLKVFGTSTGDYFTWDASAAHLKFEDNVGVGFGSNTAGVGSLGDVVIKFDGTDLLVTQATADTNVKWGVSGAGINHIFYGDTATYDMEWDQTNDRLLFKDNAKIVVGTGGDLTVIHDATNTLLTSATGNFTIDNTAATGKTIMLLGTDTTATQFDVQNNSAVAMLSVKPLSAAAGTVTTQGHRNAVGDTAVAITGATTLTLADSGGIFTVSQAAAYDIDLPSPTTGPGCTYIFSLTGPAANDVTITVAGGAATFVGTIVNDVSSVLPATGSTLTYASGAAALGDTIIIRSIATNLYHVQAISSAAGGITIA